MTLSSSIILAKFKLNQNKTQSNQKVNGILKSSYLHLASSISGVIKLVFCHPKPSLFAEAFTSGVLLAY